jgi:DNA (cytosine-5)-methyltransferase 1
MRKLRVLDLFSGVGAYSLGLERTGGFQTVAFCEIEDYPRRILRKHWPDVKIYEDVRELTSARLAADGIVPDWIVAGWPCQDISPAGTGSGLDGARSGLWAEIARLAGELRPRGLLLENSSNLLSINGGTDFGRVLGDLAALGFDAEWHCLPAAAFDAPHIRDRLWIVAMASDHHGERGQLPPARRQPAIEMPDGVGEERVAPDTAHDGRRQGRQGRTASHGQRCGDAPRHVADADSFAPVGSAIARAERHSWEPEPRVDRVVTGIANQVDRIRAIGNLNPPIIPETIGRAILAAQEAA